MVNISLNFDGKCHIHGYILYLGNSGIENKNNSNNNFFEDFLKNEYSLDINYSKCIIKDKKTSKVKSKLLNSSDPIKILVCSDKPNQLYCLNASYGDSGILDIIFTDNFNEPVRIQFSYEITQDDHLICNAKELAEFLKQTFDNFQELEEFEPNQKDIYQFLRPHSIGLRDDIENSNKIQFYSFENHISYLDIRGIKNHKFYENMRGKMQNSEIGLRVLFFEEENDTKKITGSIGWNKNEQYWTILTPNPRNIPEIGRFCLFSDSLYRERGILTHDQKMLYAMKDAVERLKKDTNSPGGIVLRKFLKNNQSISSDIDIKNNFQSSILNPIYSRFSNEQKKAVELGSKLPTLILSGKGGTGKTEVGAFLILWHILQNRRVLISGVTNSAINNTLERIILFINNNPGLEDKFCNYNFIREYAKSYSRNIPKSLQKNSLNAFCDIIRTKIEEKCSYNSNSNENLIKKEFLEVFTKNNNLKEIILENCDLLALTYGTFAKKKYKNHFPEFDLNIVDAGSNVYTSIFALSASLSKQWIVLADEAQLSPKTVGLFQRPNVLVFPTKSELLNATRYNPQDLAKRNIPKFVDKVKYKQGVVSVLNNQESSNLVNNIKFSEQFRIHPKLNSEICRIFQILEDLSICSNKINPDDFLNLSCISIFNLNPNRIKYTVCKQENLSQLMATDLKNLIEEIQKKTQYRREITVGIATMNINLTREVYSKVILFLISKKIHPDDCKNYEVVNFKNFVLTFTSLDSHLEKEYDIMLFGIGEKIIGLKNRAYTALSRSKSYVLVFGPQKTRGYTKSSERKIINRLQGAK